MDSKKIENLMGRMELEDVRHIVQTDDSLKQYRDSTVWITGATGFVGSHLTKLFLYANQELDCHIHVVAMARSREKARGLYGDFLEGRELELYPGDVTDPVCYPGRVDYIFHTASVTASKTMVEQPVQTIHTAYQGTKNMLELAREKQCRGVVYVSSMEVYGIPQENPDCVQEKDLGYLDLRNVRSSYPEGKRICECLCTAYHSEHRVPVRIARLAQTFGAGVLPGDNRVYAQFAKSVIGGKDIVLHTDGQSEGNYCYIRDVMTALLLLGVCGEAGEAYNVVNESCHRKICEMAELVAQKVADGRIKVVYDIPENVSALGYAPKVRMRLSGQKLSALGWRPEVDLVEAYKRMIADLETQ